MYCTVQLTRPCTAHQGFAHAGIPRTTHQGVTPCALLPVEIPGKCPKFKPSMIRSRSEWWNPAYDSKQIALDRGSGSCLHPPELRSSKLCLCFLDRLELQMTPPLLVRYSYGPPQLQGFRVYVTTLPGGTGVRYLPYRRAGGLLGSPKTTKNLRRKDTGSTPRRSRREQ